MKKGMDVSNWEDGKEERIDFLNEATEHIEQAIGLIRDAMQGTNYEDHADAYIIGHLQTWIGGGNPYDYSTQKYIDLFRDDEIEILEE